MYNKNGDDQKYESLKMLGSKFNNGQKAMLNNIYFDPDSDRNKPECEPVLQEMVDMMNNYSNLKIEVGGHTDNTGSADINMNLSLQSAINIKKYLASKGILKDRIIAKGMVLLNH